jgi:hypothetical protein
MWIIVLGLVVSEPPDRTLRCDRAAVAQRCATMQNSVFRANDRYARAERKEASQHIHCCKCWKGLVWGVNFDAADRERKN